MGGNKQFFTVGGMGLKPDKNIRLVAPGKFTKKTRQKKAKPNINPILLLDIN